VKRLNNILWSCIHIRAFPPRPPNLFTHSPAPPSITSDNPSWPSGFPTLMLIHDSGSSADHRKYEHIMVCSKSALAFFCRCAPWQSKHRYLTQRAYYTVDAVMVL